MMGIKGEECGVEAESSLPLYGPVLKPEVRLVIENAS